MQSWILISLLWLGFAASHILMSHSPVRQNLVARLGNGGFMGLYSLVSFAFFIPLVAVYMEHRHEGLLLWNLLAYGGVKHIAMLLAVVGLAFFVSGYFQLPPNGFVRLKDNSSRGATRITRHPMFMFLGLWGLSHLLLNGYASDVAFFAGFPIFAVLGCMHQDSRKRLRPELQEYYATTSLLPFVAILTGRNKLVLKELPWLGLSVGTVVALAFYAAHALMFY